MVGCTAHARNGHISTSALKSDVTIVLIKPDFLQDAKILAYCIEAWNFKLRKNINNTANISNGCTNESLLMAGSLIVPYRRAGHRKIPPTVTAETIARHDEKTSVGRAKVLSGGDTGYKLLLCQKTSLRQYGTSTAKMSHVIFGSLSSSAGLS